MIDGMDDAPLPGMPDTPPDTPMTLSQGEAARVCGVSQATLRRARRAGRLPGATQGDGGGWRIPVSDLIGAGFTVDRVGRDTPREGVRDTATTHPEGASQEIADLRLLLAESERARAVAEALADERGREIERADRMLRLLETRPAPPPQAPQPTPSPAPQPIPETPPSTPAAPSPPPGSHRTTSLRERWKRWRR